MFKKKLRKLFKAADTEGAIDDDGEETGDGKLSISEASAGLDSKVLTDLLREEGTLKRYDLAGDVRLPL